MFWSDAIAVVENAKDNLGRVQIYAASEKGQWSRDANIPRRRPAACTT